MNADDTMSALDSLSAFLKEQEDEMRLLVVDRRPHSLHNGQPCTGCDEYGARADKFYAWRMALEAVREMAGK